MILISLMILDAVYFFVGGSIFREMLDDVKLGWWPIVGALLLSIFWIPFLLWCLINFRVEMTKEWYIKFAGTIFEK